MLKTANLGFPRIGGQRELKKALESYWKGEVSADELQKRAQALRKHHWELQRRAGISFIPSNDFSFYDQVLDTTAMLGAVPARYNHDGGDISLALYFAMARGLPEATAMEMTKWFDTNYHYIVPELSADTVFRLSTTKAVDEYKEAKAAGIETRPVLLGPISYLLLAKMKDDSDRWVLLPAILSLYAQLLQRLAAEGAQWVQMDEPCLVLDLEEAAHKAYAQAYDVLAKSGINIMLTTYFDALADNLETAASLPVQGLHIDLVRDPGQLEAVCAAVPEEMALSLGVIDGRNIWKADFMAAEALIRKAVSLRGAENLIIAPSCSLLHVPVDLQKEKKLDAELKSWLSFAVQKLDEVRILADAAVGARDEAAFAENAAAIAARRSSARIHDAAVKGRAANKDASFVRRQSPFNQRIVKQQQHLGLPLLPTTTIGSYPQTQDIREARAKVRKGEITQEAYRAYLEDRTAVAMRWQDEIGLDVPVHGEFERNDMVEYFGEQLKGFCFTQNGWVQSYGSRCVKPPVIFGDVSRPAPMTVQWACFAQRHTEKPVKGMLTGPVTILQWSFVRDDQPRSETCRQIAFALRDEVRDLEKAGIRIIQIDEAALREGLPLRKSDWKQYLDWAVEAFRIASSGVMDETQIHTHMCYSEFNDIIEAVAAMDADVISIETSRSQMELLDSFVDFKYPNDIGPGVYDIHSPRVPAQAEMEALLRKALKVIPPEQLWVNPDCGLKTRGWMEVKPAIEAMVRAAQKLRAELAEKDIKRATA